jgi:hypothetical protein
MDAADMSQSGEKGARHPNFQDGGGRFSLSWRREF